ncbi:cadherin-23-like protein [Sarcoptes scabiei]|uniref:Cadherin-23-like protein n=1 Tax=Sarcoptes scabiei TaxID=52283 RepID=A0A132AB67_SARSC|nr:cadherin-23-like protein [Sarcoptes scabiei]
MKRVFRERESDNRELGLRKRRKRDEDFGGSTSKSSLFPSIVSSPLPSLERSPKSKSSSRSIHRAANRMLAAKDDSNRCVHQTISFLSFSSSLLQIIRSSSTIALSSTNFFSSSWFSFLLIYLSVISSVLSSSSSGGKPNLPPRFKTEGSDFDSQSEIVVRVKEGDSSLKKEIYHLHGEDPDNDPLTFGVLGTLGKDILRIESISANEAKIYLKKELDREIQDSYTLVLTLTDGKLGKGNYITKSLLLIVEDINDNAPIFRPYRTAVLIREDAKPGTLIETFEAFDSDEGRFGQVFYQLEDDDHNDSNSIRSHLFSIQTIDGKGILRLSGQLDYERKTLYQLRILAIDRATEDTRKTSTASIVIQVEDVDDQPPIFTSIPSVTRISEDAPIGGVVLQVTAIDGDKGVNNQITYRISKGGEKGLFVINSNTGVVTVAGKLDREAIQPNSGSISSSAMPITFSNLLSASYILEIEATEVTHNVFPPPSITTEVTIILTDVNDEPPRFRLPLYLAEIMENSPPDMPITFIGRNSRKIFLNGNRNNDDDLTQASSTTISSTPQVYDLDQGNNGTFTLHLDPILDDDGDGGDSKSEKLNLKNQLVDAFYVTPLQSTNEATLSVRVKNSKILDYEKLKQIKLRMIAKERSPSAGHRNHRFGSADLIINIKDANDNSPYFNQEIYYGSVSERPSPGTIVAQVSATDLDDDIYGTDGIRYTSLKGEFASILSLDQITGIITVKNDSDVVDSMLLDRERYSQHFLIVEARDANGFGNKNTVQLVINITDVNDHRPRFLNSPYFAKIYENQMRFEQDLIVNAIDNDAPNTANSRLTYSIVNDSSPYASHFQIDPNYGQIHIVKSLDFELIPGPIADSRNISFKVRAQDNGQPPLDNEVTIMVLVFDQNDNAPVFSKSLYSKSIPEDVRDGSMVIQVGATDADQSPIHSRVYYRLLSGGADKFVIDSNTGIISVAKGASLDPDKSISIGNAKISKKLWYLLKVMAIDSSFGNDEQLSSIATVNVSIIDVNNKAPEFPNNLPEVFVAEDAKINQYVTKISALDLDDKPVLRYSFDYTRSEARNEFGVIVELPSFIESFSIGPIDGIVRVAKVLDRELWSILRLQVIVEDIAAITKGQKAKAMITIHITDVNDNPPMFNQKIYRAIVPENSIPGTSVITITAEDRDTNKSLTYSLESEEYEILRLLRINSSTGEITVLGRIDREIFNWLNLTVRAIDNGPVPLSGTAIVAVQVLDENDNNPVFIDDDLQMVTIPENATIGSLVVQVKASDADSGAFGKLTYLLDSSSTMGKFKIDRETGSIIVTEQLDREQTSSYKLLVQAWDNYEYGYTTGESRRAFKTLTILISDVNDETPKLVSPIISDTNECIFVTEFHGLNEPVTTIQARDNDDQNSPNGQVSFTIDDGNEEQLFELAPINIHNSIQLRTSNSLRERVGNVTLTVRLTDGGQPSHSSTSLIKICITDVNDHNPIFVKPPSNMTIRIPENATIGTKVVDVLALDSDHGQNAEVRYRLRELPNGHWRSFQIDPVLGAITLAKELDRETLRLHELRVQAYDLGLPLSLSTDLDITVLVTNIDDFEPEFTQDIFQVLFTENLDPGTEKYKLLPTIDKDDYDLNDPSTAFKSIPCYFIVGGDGFNADGEAIFKLDTFTHELATTKALDRETKSNYTIIVQATNDCFRLPHRIEKFDPKDNSMLQVLIGVKDVNDNPPKFLKKIFSGGITTNTEYGTIFMSIKAIDPDSGVNSYVSYHIISDVRKSFSEGLEAIPSNPFEINHKNGDIKLNFDPQKGMKGYFEFEVKANDTDGLYDIAKVFIYLLRDDQRVRFVLRLTPQELRTRLDKFQDVLANITGAMVNVDSYRFHETEDGSVDQKKTDLYLHFVNREDNSIMEVNSILLLIDKNIDYLDDLYKEFNVLISEPTTMAEPFMEWEDQLKAGLAGISAFLFLLLILVVSLCLNQKSRYERQLKAATVPIFGHEPQLTRSNVPNTNQHATEGSNPMWMTGYDNQWYKEEERLSSSSNDDSLDENALTGAVDDEHLNFSSLDTLDHVDASEQIVRSESSGNSSSSTTNDRSVLCRVSQNLTKSSATSVTAQNRSGNFGTCARRPHAPVVPSLSIPKTSEIITSIATDSSVPVPPKKPAAPKPPHLASNIVVISSNNNQSKDHHLHHNHSHHHHNTNGIHHQANIPNGNVKKNQCVNNIYIETFSNHHKNSNNVLNGSVSNGISNDPKHHHRYSQQQQLIHENGHYHHYHHHHHHPAQHHYFGMAKNGSEMPPPHLTTNGHLIAESQLMNLETTEL